MPLDINMAVDCGLLIRAAYDIAPDELQNRVGQVGKRFILPRQVSAVHGAEDDVTSPVRIIGN